MQLQEFAAVGALFAWRQEDDKSAPKTRTDNSDHRIRPRQETVTVCLNLNGTGHSRGEKNDWRAAQQDRNGTANLPQHTQAGDDRTRVSLNSQWTVSGLQWIPRLPLAQEHSLVKLAAGKLTSKQPDRHGGDYVPNCAARNYMLPRDQHVLFETYLAFARGL